MVSVLVLAFTLDLVKRGKWGVMGNPAIGRIARPFLPQRFLGRVAIVYPLGSRYHSNEKPHVFSVLLAAELVDACFVSLEGYFVLLASRLQFLY